MVRLAEKKKRPIKQDWARIEDQSYASQLYSIDNSVVDPPIQFKPFKILEL